MIGDVKTTIASLGLANGTATSLNAKLDAALDALGQGQTSLACSSLQDFINAVRAQAGKKISTSDAASLTADVTEIREALGC